MEKSEGIDNVELSQAINELATDRDIQAMYSMDEAKIRRNLKSIKVTDTGFDMSPNFQSVGYNENESNQLEINLSDIGNSLGTLKHELKHSLHVFAAVDLFEDDSTRAKVVNVFRDNVLGDPEFTGWIEKNCNQKGKDNFEKISKLFKSGSADDNELKNMALILGSITYQHAYFIDPAMCEAVASYKDKGAFLTLNSFLNRNLGMALPERQAIEGYLNKQYQQQAIEADQFKLCLMVKRQDFNPDKYWGGK